MASINKVILIAHLGADPELRAFANGDAVCNPRLATSEKWKDKASGETKEESIAKSARKLTRWGPISYFHVLRTTATLPRCPSPRIPRTRPPRSKRR